MKSRCPYATRSRQYLRRPLPLAACVLLAACAGGGDGGEQGGIAPPPPPPPAQRADFRDEIVYQLLTDRFFNGDASNDNGQLDRRGDAVDPSNPVGWHGGDFAGIRRKLEEGYFQRMGFTAIWISPVVIQVPAPGNGGGVNANQPFVGFHGYWVDRFDAIEPHFGELAELRALGRAADAAAVRLIVDVVVNHVGPGSTLVAQNPTWFRTGAQCGSDDLTLCLSGLPDFRQEVAGVSDFLLGTIRYLCDNVAIDGLRMDTMKHVGDTFWAQFFAAGSPADATRLWTVGEVFSSSVPQIAHYLDDVGAPSVFDFPLKFAIVDSLARAASTRRLGEVLAQDARYRDPTRLGTFIDNHDVWRFVSEAQSAGMAPDEAMRRLDLALSLLYMARGTPVVYYGTEIGMRGEGDSYDKPLGASSREDMDFSQLAGSSLDERLGALAAARKQFPALRRGLQIVTAGCYTFALNAISTLNPVLTINLQGAAGIDPDLFGFARTMSGEKSVIVVLNNQRSAVDLSMLAGGGIDLQGLIADGAVVEITGANHDLRVSGGRLRGMVPALTTLSVTTP